MPERQPALGDDPTVRPPRAIGWAVLIMFFLSGVAALVYQIVWAKQLALIFGVTVYATSAVVTAFMAGLALGSLYFGRVVDRWKRPLLLFALLEGGIAAFGALFPAIAAVLKHVYVMLYGPLGQSHYLMSLARFLLSFLVLLIPTSLMGGTLPVLVRAYVSRKEHLGGDVAGLYAVNNFGAFVGCVAAGFVFLEFIGVTGTLWLAVLLNLTAAAISIGLDARARLRTDSGWSQPPMPDILDERSGVLSRQAKVALYVLGIAGFTSLAFQMAWVRLLIFFVRTDIYGVTVIIAAYLVGLSLGALLVKSWIDRVSNPFRVLGALEMGIGISALATIPLLPRVLGVYATMERTLEGWGLAGWTIERFAICFFVVLVPTSFMGATLPVVSRIYVEEMRGLGRKIGIIGCLDTVGAIFGSFAGGFVMIPLLGIQRTIVATALVNLGLAAWVFVADSIARRRRLLRVGLVASAGALLAGPLLLALKPVPLIIYSRPVRDLLRQIEIVDYREDADSSVTVLKEYGSYFSLFVDHSVVAQTTRYDRPSHELIAHVPLLVHPDPKRTLLIGYGIGFTTWAARVHDVDVDVVELSPGVRRANVLFSAYNNNILSDPRVHLYIDDGRNYVLGTPQKYDVIQAGITHPAVSSGNAGFYTVDFYRECKRILMPRGVLCMWLPLHGIPVEDFRMLIRTFQSEFPYTSIWYKYTPDFCMLIGTQEPLKIDFQNVEARVNRPEIRAHLARCDVAGVYDLLDSFCLADDAVTRAVGPGLLHTDNHPYIEFHCNRPVPRGSQLACMELLAGARERVFPRLINIPVERRPDVQAQLERWFAATQYLLAGEHATMVLRNIGPGNPQYASYSESMRGAFERVLSMNPADKNAEFLWKCNLIAHHLMTAAFSIQAGRRAEALSHLAEAARIAPETPEGGEAKYLYDQASGRGPK